MDKLTFIIFGASGDLAKLKIYPAFYELEKLGLIKEDFEILGFGRTKISKNEFEKIVKKSIENSFKDIDQKTLKKILAHCSYHSGEYENEETYNFLRTKKNIISYLSVPPFLFGKIITNLAKLKKFVSKQKLIIEKPFGNNGKSAKELYQCVINNFSEENIFLLDHYLGKPAIQSLLHLRHTNPLINMMLKGPSISKIEITANENFGVENRKSYFDEVGIIKDMIQSHLLQILALLTMSIPVSEKASSIQKEKYNILSALEFKKTKNNLIIGQYEGYGKNSTPTYAALELNIDRESWHKAPIFIRTGKNLKDKHTYIAIELKKFDFQEKNEKPNRIIIHLQPKNIIELELNVKNGQVTEPQKIVLSSACTVSPYKNLLSEHAMLISEVMKKEHRYFLSFNEVLACWDLVDKISDFTKKIKPKIYKKGTSGPKLPKNFNWYDL